MPYDNNIPLAADQISASQSPINQNFGAIQTFVGVNHVNFNVANAGKHAFCTFPVQAGLAAPLADEINLFSRQSAFSAQPEIAFQRSAGAIQEITTSLAATPGWAFTSSGMLLKWGQATALAADYPAGTTIVFPVAGTIPVYGTIFMVYITTISASAGDSNLCATLKGFTTANVTVLGTQRTVQATSIPTAANVVFDYLAIGIQ